MSIIQRDRSVIPACDVGLDLFEKIVKETADVDGVGGYKVGFQLALEHGLPKIVEVTRRHSTKPVIYDHQKAGTDIPDTGAKFAEVVKSAGVNAVILFPQSGPVTEYEWILAAQEAGLGVIVGGEMTHPRYLADDNEREGKNRNYTEIFEALGFVGAGLGGFIDEDAPEVMYELAAKLGVTEFVVPGNKPDRIEHYRGIIEDAGVKNPVFYSPGLIAQGGDPSKGAEAAGERFHAIVGRGIYNADDIRKAAVELTSKL